MPRLSTLACAASSMAALAAPALASDPHPTLPTNWVSRVSEPQVGIVDESYRMVLKPTEDNLSGKWTNFTDGSCQRLIRVANNYDDERYLLGCDSLPCCTEKQSGNHMECT